MGSSLARSSATFCTSAASRPKRLPRSLRIIQKLDPPGVGARDLRECLLLQLEARARRRAPMRRREPGAPGSRR
ncbi:MAG: hypothetical protein DMD60_11330 [Gemmatimonadetes bacterium]|nr:MAG: hypothetical protein DMD60_11330 [Gemmatimonadota bacterium]